MILRKRNSDIAAGKESKRRVLATTLVMLIAVTLQVGFWEKTYMNLPQLGILKPVPSNLEAEALSFGDKQLYFRAQALNLQFMGDTWGRSTPLKDYDYKEVYKWLSFLDKYDPKSDILPSAAAYYYAKTQRPSDVRYLLDYLEERADKDLEANWWWLSQSIYLANSVLQDRPRAARMAAKLRSVKADIPIWARQMEAFVQEDLGDKEKSADVMCEVIRNYKNFESLPKEEIDYFVYFFQERLKTWKGKENELIEYCAMREAARRAQASAAANEASVPATPVAGVSPNAAAGTPVK
jgi:hypothetical protein